MEKIIVEISGAYRARKECKVFIGPFITVGRSYHNDLILSDPHISPDHLVIRRDEDGYVVEDLGSENGTYIDKYKENRQKALIKSGETITIGRTHLRVLSPAHPVTSTRQLSQTHGVLRGIQQPVVAWSLVAAMCAQYTWEGYMESSENLPFGQLVVASMILIILILVWGGIWAFIGRLVKHKAQFNAQLSLAALFFILLSPLINIGEYLGFVASNANINAIAAGTLVGLLCTVFLIGNLGFATNMSKTKRIIASTTVTTVVLCLTILFFYAFKDEFNPNPRFHTVLKPPIIKVSGRSIDQFLQNSSKVFDIKTKK